MKHLFSHFRGLILIALLFSLPSAMWGAVSSLTPVAGKSYVFVAYYGSTYYAFPYVTDGATPDGVEVSVNANGQVVSQDNLPLWTLSVVSGKTDQFYISYKSGSKTYYLYKTGTTGNNYKIAGTTSTSTRDAWAFTKNSDNTTYSIVTQKSSATKHKGLLYYNGSFCVRDVTDKYANIMLLEVAPASTTSKVTLNTNGGTINSGNITEYTEGTGATLPTDVTKTGFSFDGWFDNSALTGSAITAISASDKGDKEFWAKWTAKSYTITLDKNDHGTANGSASVKYDAALGAGDYSAVSYDNTAWNLLGYYTSDTDGERVIDEDGSLVANVAGYTQDGKWVHDSNVTLYAHFESASVVRYDVNLTQPDHATIDADFTSAKENDEITLSYRDVDEHYHFVSWSVVDAESNPITVTDNKFRMPASDVTVSATFAEDAKFAVTYHVNGNTSAKASVNLYEGDAIDLTAPTTGIPMDYEFKGWIEASSYYSETDAPTFVTSATMGTSAKHYYAVFAKQKSAGGTVDYQLTSSAISENLTASTRAYADAETSYDDGTVKWGFVGYVQTAKCKFLQIRNTSPASYISFEAPAAITNVALGVTNGSDNNFTGDIYIKTSADATSSSNDENIVGSGTSTNKQSSIAVSGTHTKLYMQVSAAARITSITLTCKSAPVYSDYCTDVKDIHHIKVTTAPTKVLYKVGESLDIAGMVVTAYYDAEETDSRVLSSGYTVTPNAALTTSDANITVTLNADNTKTATTPIDVVALDKIVATGAKNTYYVSQDFDPAGLVVTATWGTEEGKKIEEEVTASVTITGDKNLQHTANSVQISYTHEGTTKTFDYAITVSQSSEKALTRLTMSNGFKPFITSTDLVAYYIHGSEVPTINESSIAVSPYATKRVEDNNIIVTAQDGTEATYTVTTTEVAPLMTSTTETVTFDGSDDEKTWIKTGYTFDSDKGWRIAKNLDDSKESRIVNGKNRIYFYIGPATSFKLINGGIDTNRDIKVFVNNTETDITSIGKKSGSDNFILLTSQLADNSNNVICIESANTGGDAGFTQYELTINPKHHIIYKVNGAAAKEEDVYEGYALTFPSVADQGGKVFLGWKKGSGIDGVVEDFSDFADTKVNATESVDYYAVFATATGTASTNYSKISAMADLTDNDYVIAYDYNGGTQIVMGNSINASNFISATNLSLSNGKYANPDADYIWTIKKVVNGDNTYYTLYNADADKYAKAISSGVSLVDDAYKFTITWDNTNSVFRIQSTTNTSYYLHGFVSGSSYDFRSSTSGGGDKYHLHLYKSESTIRYSAYATSFATSGELALVAENTDGKWATFSSDRAVEFMDVDATVYAVSVDNRNAMSLVEVKSKQVPANTGVLVKAASTSVNYTFIASADDLPTTNCLRPGAEEVTAEANHTYYRLAYDNYAAQTGLGFYYVVYTDESKTTFYSKVGGAYLDVPTTAAPARFVFGQPGVATAVENANLSTADGKKVLMNGVLYIIRDGKTYDSFGRLVK